MDEHDQIKDLAAEYALGILDPAELRRVEEHLGGCDDCRRYYGEMQAAGNALALSMPPLEAPPELRARIVAAATARPQAVVSRRQWGGWAVGIAAATVAVLVGVDDVRQRRELAAELADLAVVEQQLTLQQVIAQPVLAGQPYVRLAPVSGTGPSVIWVNPVGKSPYIAAPSLPALQPDRTYQLWFLQGSKPLPSVTFRSGSVLTLPALPAGTTALAVTVEPQGGSPAPTTRPIMVGTV